ncbi:MAG TPA: RIP metalloprotease RseP [Patescibacteria group bacterium]
MLLTIISFILVLSVLVLIHELGHFLTAKKLGIKVEEFGFGFPPRIWGKKIGETIYSINLLPIGGFVKLYGEDEAGGGQIKLKVENEKLKDKDIKRAFFARPVWQRAAIVVAGVVMNFLLAVSILTYLVMVQGVPSQGNNVVIAEVAKDSPAQKAGLKTGEAILSIDGQKIVSAQQIISYTKKHLGKEILLQVKDEKSKVMTISVTPRVHYPSNEGAMGIAIGANIVITKYPWYEAPWVGLKEALNQTVMILQGFGQLISNLVVSRQVPQDLAGPVGIAQLTGQFVQLGFNAVLSLLALLSLNLAIINVLPIPALDGGRLFFILLEGLTGKKVSPKVEGYIHTAGMAFLMALIILITFHDIGRILSGQSLIPR